MFSLGIHPLATQPNQDTQGTRKPIRIAITTEVQSSQQFQEKPPISTNMIYYSFDPQFATLIFSVYSRNDRLALSVMPDAFGFSASATSSNAIITYAHSVGLQLIALGNYYANLFTQVRVGSVIFLVGVGSLVCWKLWEYWSNGAGINPGDGGSLSRPKPTGEQVFSKITSKKTREFLASFLEEEFVDDIEDLDDEDPALIQGKYFGPDSPGEIARKIRRKIEESSPLSSEYSSKSHSVSARQYLADNSDSCSADEDVGFQTSDQYDSLPFDDDASAGHPQMNKKLKKRHRPHGKDRGFSWTSSNVTDDQVISKMDLGHTYGDSLKKSNSQSRFHAYGRSSQSLVEDFSSSETSPRLPFSKSDSSSKLQRFSRISPFASVLRRQGDGSETPDSEEVQFRNPSQSKGFLKALKYKRYANDDSDDEDWINNDRVQPEGKEEVASDSQMMMRRTMSRDASMSNLAGRFRHRSGQISSMSRENSVTSGLSDFLRRDDDSFMSNLSEYCASEGGSEFSFELSCRDESIANQTITFFADIEDQLNTLKTSMNDIDEDFGRFTSIPNPYLLKTTFSDYSFDSDSRPGSALDLVSSPKSRLHLKYGPDAHMNVDLLEANDENELEAVNDESLSRKVSFDIVSPPIYSPDEKPLEDKRNRFFEKIVPDRQERLPPAVAYMKSKSEKRSRVNHESIPDFKQSLPPAAAFTKYNTDTRSQTNHESTYDLKELMSPLSGQNKSRSFQRQYSNISLKRTVTQEEVLNALEWDNDCLTQYKEDNADFVDGFVEDNEGIREIEGFSEFEPIFKRTKYLPDHASLELDLETELRESPSTTAFSGREAIISSLTPAMKYSLLQHDSYDLFPEASSRPSPPSSLPLNKSFISMSSSGMGSSMDSSGIAMNTSFSSSVYQPTAGMTTSVDSAIYSTPVSRSGSSSPQPLMQSMMSSGLGASWTELSPDTSIDTETSGIYLKKKRLSGDLNKSWSSEESGYVEVEGCLESTANTLSPVHEIRENEYNEIDDTNCNNNFDSKNEEATSSLLPSNDNQFTYLNDNRTNLHYDYSSNRNVMGNNATIIKDLHYPETPRNNSLTETALIKAVDDKIEISKYADQEWKGTTPKAKTIRQGYSAIPDELELNFLRRIRGDNYCGVRAVMYQILSNGLPTPSSYQTYSYLMSEINKGSSWIRDYSFGNRLDYAKDQVVNGMKECLHTFDKMANELTNCENKESVLQSRLNEDPTLDVRLCEAVKLNMLVSAMELYKQELNGEQVPLFSMIMFARQNCSNPREFLMNHLNPVGDSAGLEQDQQKIEMFLLGYALQIIVQVVRPSCYGKEDFICFYPDENIGVWPEVTLVAEDDRHYNVLVK